MPYDPDRLAELMLLAADRLHTDPSYGATKLNKALFFSDFLHYKRHGDLISAAVYQRLPRAPGPEPQDAHAAASRVAASASSRVNAPA